ncbi:MAG: MBL fold metallo-hydrolase [Desulfovibrio sp.]|nr:MBL fold metallo-hydrolase [Desulfovibrio sp.]
MHIAVFFLGPLETTCCLVHDDRECIVIDPGGESSQVIMYLKERGLNLTHILCTHLHFDHTMGVQELVEAFGVPVHASEADRYLLQSELGRGGVWGMPLVKSFEFQGIEHGEHSFLDARCDVLPTPGHTPGGLSFYFPGLEAVFAGDTLFYRSIGRSDFPGGNQTVLERSIRERLFSLPENTRVYSGHGPATSIGDERRNNPYVGDFKRF